MRIRILSTICLGILCHASLQAQTDTLNANDQLTSMQAQDSLEQRFAHDPLINTAFSKTRRNAITGTVTAINPDELLKYDNVHTVQDMINGRIPGSLGGVDVRGLGSALIVVDGFPRPIASVNINEVEQITVLKDASAALFYGVMGRNGVILITTKRGRANHKVIRATAEYGMGRPISFPNYLGSADYMELYNEALQNDGLSPLYTAEAIAGTRSGSNPVKYPDVNYFNSGFLRSSQPFHRVVGEFSGGSQGAQYYVNMGWSRSGSILNLGEGANQHTDRLNMRSNLNFKLSNAIQSTIDIVGIFDIDRNANGNFFSDATTLLPNYYPALIDASLVTDKAILKTAKMINGHVLGGTSVYKNNIYGNMYFGGYRTQMNTSVMFNNGFNVDLGKLVKGLKFKTLVGFDFYNQFVELQSNTYAVYEPVFTNDELSLKRIGIDKSSGTQGIENTNMKRRSNFTAALEYTTELGAKSTLGASMMYYYDKYNETDVFQSDKHAHAGAAVSYAYNKRYLVDLSAAFVYSPKLAEGNRLGVSPSIGLGWVLSEEDFLKGSSVIDFLKIKASGSIMNSDLGLTKYYAYENIYNYGAVYAWNDNTRSNNATVQTNVVNNDLFYEKRKEVNLGVEMAMLNRSLSFDLNVFKGRRDGQIVQRNNAYPDYMGGLNPFENYNADSYQGVELGMNWRKNINDLVIELGTSMMFVKYDAGKRDENWDFDYQNRAGKPLGATFGLEALGFFANDDDIANHPVQQFGAVHPGDIKYKDQNNDGRIDAQDEVMIGNTIPDLAGGFTVNLHYKGLSLFALLTSTFGSERYYNNAYYQVYGDRKYSEVVWNRWTPATAATATYPRLTSTANANNFRQSTFWLYDNSRVNLARVQFSYTFSNRVASSLRTKDFSFFVRGSNLATFARNSDRMQLNIGTEPQFRYYSLGLKASF